MGFATRAPLVSPVLSLTVHGTKFQVFYRQGFIVEPGERPRGLRNGLHDRGKVLQPKLFLPAHCTAVCTDVSRMFLFGGSYLVSFLQRRRTCTYAPVSRTSKTKQRHFKAPPAIWRGADLFECAKQNEVCFACGSKNLVLFHVPIPSPK